MFVSCVCCVSDGSCDEVILSSEESYRLRVSVCGLETSTVWRSRPELDCCVTENVCVKLGLSSCGNKVC